MKYMGLGRGWEGAIGPGPLPKVSSGRGLGQAQFDGLDRGDHLFQALLPGLAFGLFQVDGGGDAREAAQERPQGVFQAGLLLFEPLVHQGEEVLEFQALPVIEELASGPPPGASS